MIKRVVLSGACILGLVALPAAAQAKQQSGVILQLDRAHHSVELVDGRHAVHHYMLAARAPRLRTGSKISYRTRGKRVVALHAAGRAKRYSFLARVAASGSNGLVLKLADGRRVRLPKARKHAAHKAQANAAGAVSVNVEGLQPGQIVLLTEATDGSGNVTITIKLVPGGDASGGEDRQVSGTVSALDGQTMTVAVDGHGDMTFQVDPDLVDGISVGDSVDVSYYEDAGTLVADDVEPSGSSGEDQTVSGTVSAIGDQSLVLSVPGQPDMTFQADPDVLDGISVGDSVDVSYYEDAGTLVADDVEPSADQSGGDGQDQSSTDSPQSLSAPTSPLPDGQHHGDH